jgi:hypothetical protein
MSSKPKRIRAGNFSAEEKEMTLGFCSGALRCVGEQNRGSEHLKKKEEVVGRISGENEEGGSYSISFKVEGQLF